VLTAWGILADGKKAMLHLAPGSKEDTASCREFFQDMRRRGLPDPLLVVSDGASGIIRAIEECLPRSLLGAQDEQPAKQVAGGHLAGVQGPCHGVLPGGPPALARLRDDIRQPTRRICPRPWPVSMTTSRRASRNSSFRSATAG
jgi:hypothetical protein